MSATIEEISALMDQRLGSLEKKLSKKFKKLNKKIETLESEIADVQENESYKKTAQMYIGGGMPLAKSVDRDIDNSTPFSRFDGYTREDHLSSFDQG